MIVQLYKQPTGLSYLMEIPVTFFLKLENADTFDINLFPDWFNEVFGTTNNLENGLYQKFNRLYLKYKSIADKAQRDLLVKAFTDGIQIENLCNRISGIEAKPISGFPEVSNELKSVLMHLWKNSLQYDKFETLKAKTTVKEYAKNFINTHHSQICPFCGLEGYLYVAGQSRPALDHWLCKDDFPYSSVNFDNLIPIGDKCNESPAKGTKNVLSITGGTKVFYPFTEHSGIKVTVSCKKVPTIPDIENGVYEIEIEPTDSNNQDIFDSWDSLFNIKTNYKSYLEDTLLNSWKLTYKEYIEKSKKLKPANTVDELINNLEYWQDSFQPNITIGFLVLDAFVENLLSMPKAYLYGLCEYFKRS
ncbi:hypothetical protein [uncultured Aquimarina sp.]|uniref:hypothetical protein n=1 Tax=uncultured Aquimarina sp. TaxID=575652 RepID=UPI00260FA11B|nr:hypothetical protein [uncultured Aquimarina sp.]